MTPWLEWLTLWFEGMTLWLERKRLEDRTTRRSSMDEPHSLEAQRRVSMKKRRITKVKRHSQASGRRCSTSQRHSSITQPRFTTSETHSATCVTRSSMEVTRSSIDVARSLVHESNSSVHVTSSPPPMTRSRVHATLSLPRSTRPLARKQQRASGIAALQEPPRLLPRRGRISLAQLRELPRELDEVEVGLGGLRSNGAIRDGRQQRGELPRRRREYGSRLVGHDSSGPSPEEGYAPRVRVLLNRGLNRV